MSEFKKLRRKEKMEIKKEARECVEINGKRFEMKEDNSLYLREKGIRRISDINGLENLTNLKELNLSANKIGWIEGLENLPNLEKLLLSENHISEIKGLDNLINLKTLWLDTN